jgi:hypothetical protein
LPRQRIARAGPGNQACLVLIFQLDGYGVFACGHKKRFGVPLDYRYGPMYTCVGRGPGTDGDFRSRAVFRRACHTTQVPDGISLKTHF